MAEQVLLHGFTVGAGRDNVSALVVDPRKAHRTQPVPAVKGPCPADARQFGGPDNVIMQRAAGGRVTFAVQQAGQQLGHGLDVRAAGDTGIRHHAVTVNPGHRRNEGQDVTRSQVATEARFVGLHGDGDFAR